MAYQRTLSALAGAAFVGLFTGAISCRSEPQRTSDSATKIPERSTAPISPTVRLLVFTDLEGELEPCGCTERSLGGVDRLISARQSNTLENVPTLAFAAGALFVESHTAKATGTWSGTTYSQLPREAELKRARAVADALPGFQLSAAVAGSVDLELGPELVGELAQRARVPILLAGATFLESDAKVHQPRPAGAFEQARSNPFASGLNLEVAGLKLGVVGYVESRAQGPNVVALSADALQVAAARARELRRSGAQLLIGLVSGSPEAAKNLTVAGGLDLAILADGSELFPEVGEHLLLRAGKKGRYLLVADVWTGREKANWVRWESTTTSPPQASSNNWVRWSLKEMGRMVPPNAEARALISSYSKQINTENQHRYADTLPLPATPATGGYVGSRPCASCHTAAYLWWEKTPHGNAYKSLADANKEFHLDCVGCHVTGYQKPGGSTVTHLLGLTNVGCESCHGPGSAHIADSRPPLRLIRRAVAESTCASCHTREHSPSFDFSTYRDALIVPGHGQPL